VCDGAQIHGGHRSDRYVIDGYSSSSGKSGEMIITGRHVAAARELLEITQHELAEATDLGSSTIERFEKGESVRASTVEKIQKYLEDRGIRFMNGGNPGVQRMSDETRISL